MPSFQSSGRLPWLVMLATWAVAGMLIFLEASVGRGYVALLDAQGLRGADEARTPLRQVIPARYADTQMWVRHVLDGQDAGAGRVRFTTVDNAPIGREVHWSSPLAWLLRAAAKVQATVAGPPAEPAALERTLLWFNAPLLFAVVVLWSGWAARCMGLWAGVLVACALVGHQRFREAFEPAYVDHHALVNAALLGFVLGAACMGFGWWQPAPAPGIALLPVGSGAARRAAIVSALSGAFAMWISAASTLPVIAIVGLGGLVAAGWHGRAAQAGDARFDPGVWRLWGRTGAIASTVFYFVEYAPAHLGWRLEVNHPLYALAWWGGAEVVAILGAAWLGQHPAGTGQSTGVHPGETQPLQGGARRSSARYAVHSEKAARGAGRSTLAAVCRLGGWRLLFALAAVAAPPIAILVGGQATFLPSDPFVALLRHFVVESRSLPAMVREFGLGTVGYDLVSALILVPAVLLLRRRDDTRLVLGALAFITSAYLVQAFFVVRWWVVGSVIQITLLLWLVAAWSGSPRRRWTATLTIAGLLLLVPTAFVIARDHRANRRRAVAAIDLFQPLNRDLAATLRASQPEGPIVLLASPNVSAGVGYFGRFQSIGTLFWENVPGLRGAAEIFCAGQDDEALRLIQARGVTHIAMLSAAPFVEEYFSLLHPTRPRADAKRTFGLRLIGNPAAAPRWLQPIPYRKPAELAAAGGEIHLFKVVPAQTEDQRFFHTGVALAARGETDAAEKAFLSALALVPASARADLCGYAGESAYQQGAHVVAVRMLRRALQLNRDPELASLAAWILATSTDPAARDGVEALALIGPLARQSPDDPTIASTLAAAYAEVGRFEEAIRAAEHALTTARKGGADARTESLLAERLTAYRARRPWRQ